MKPNTSQTSTASARPVALITGAARRIGNAIARALHAAGYDLALHYRHSQAEMDSLCSDLESARASSTVAIRADLDDIDRLAAIVEACIARFGRLDALINNASTFYPTPVASATSKQWDELFASNAKAPFFLAQAAAMHLQNSQGSIVNIVDIYAERPLADHSLYCMAKAALGMLTLSLAKDLAPHVRVNGIAPGAVLWPDAGKGYANQNDLVARTPLQRMGEPADIANAVLFLLRDAHYTTGEILHVDGGRTLII